MRVKEFWGNPLMVSRNMSYAIRTRRLSSPTFIKEVQQAVWSVNANLPVASIQTLDEIRADSMAQTSFALVMLSIAAAVALFLGIVGIYGVTRTSPRSARARSGFALLSARRAQT